LQAHRHTAVVVLAALAMTACTTTAESQPEPTPTQLASFEEGASGLRGVPAKHVDCQVKLDEAYVKATVIVPDPTAVMVCSNNRGPAGIIRLAPSNPSFEPLIETLSRPNHVHADRPCPAVIEAPQALYAQTADGLFRVAIPVGSCGYQAQAKHAIRAVSSAGIE